MPHVSFNPQGRAGNYFWACATAYAYSLKHGLNFTAPFFTSSEVWSPIYLKHLQNQDYDPTLPQITINEKHFHYAELPFSEDWRNKNILLRGYFQAIPYIEPYRNEIIKAFDLPWHHKKDTCSIHARYSDYLSIVGKHIVMNETYLKQAMEIIRTKTGITKFKVFSDELILFKERHGHLYDFEYSTNTNEIDDLVEISCCSNNINSSSTFSFWAAWLNRNPDKIVVTPFDWFQPGWDNADTKDIVPSDWIKI